MNRIDTFFNPYKQEHLRELEEYLCTGKWNDTFLKRNNILVDEDKMLNMFKMISFAWLRKHDRPNKGNEKTTENKQPNLEKELVSDFIKNVKNISDQNINGEKYKLGTRIVYDGLPGIIVDAGYIRNTPRLLIQFGRTDFKWVEIEKIYENS